jgi:hypothetical protein
MLQQIIEFSQTDPGSVLEPRQGGATIPRSKTHKVKGVDFLTMNLRHGPTFLWLMFARSELGAGYVNSQLLRVIIGIRVVGRVSCLGSADSEGGTQFRERPPFRYLVTL